jgi:hypothetical protein
MLGVPNTFKGDAMTTSNLPAPDNPHDRKSRAEQEARRAREVVTLLDRHAELRGVNAMADFLADAVRWTA